MLLKFPSSRRFESKRDPTRQRLAEARRFVGSSPCIPARMQPSIPIPSDPNRVEEIRAVACASAVDHVRVTSACGARAAPLLPFLPAPPLPPLRSRAWSRSGQAALKLVLNFRYADATLILRSFVTETTARTTIWRVARTRTLRRIRAEYRAECTVRVQAE